MENKHIAIINACLNAATAIFGEEADETKQILEATLAFNECARRHITESAAIAAQAIVERADINGTI